MIKFKGFSEGEQHPIPIPGVFFTDLLTEMDDLDELRVTLFAFWNFNGQVTEPRYLSFSNLTRDERLAKCFGSTEKERNSRLTEALDKACKRGILIAAGLEGETYYFLNSERGQAACEGLKTGLWRPGDEQNGSLPLLPQRPNIYALYEQNIGPLTPILAETLQDAENNYPVDWIEEAIRIAVVKNVRTWRYVEAILKSWKEKGRDGTDRKSAEENRKRDSEGKYADFINR